MLVIYVLKESLSEKKILKLFLLMMGLLMILPALPMNTPQNIPQLSRQFTRKMVVMVLLSMRELKMQQGYFLR